MKRTLGWLAGVWLMVSTAAAMGHESPRIGVLVYNGTDTFISHVSASIEKAAEGRARILFRDSYNSQILQNEQVGQLLAEGVDALIVNAVDRTSAVYLIRMVAPHGIPIVFNNREPLLEDLLEYDKAFYVGNNPKESGLMCGELIACYVREHPEILGEDQILQYVMLKGEPGHQDAELRTVYSIKALKDAGIQLERLQETSAMWERSIAQEKMAGFIASYGNRIECVISNNDEMALGAIEALKAAGYFSDGRTIPVVGVDATSAAREALLEGTLLGTVLNNAEAQGNAALSLALLLMEEGPLNEEDFPYPLDQKPYLWIPSEIVTRETLE